jgi:hypothetical protein
VRALALPLLTIALLAAPAAATTKACKAACKAAKKACVQAAGAAFVAAKGDCPTDQPDRRTCIQAARADRASARAACQADRATCVAACGSTATTSTTLPGGPPCGDPEPAALVGITKAHDAVRANPSLDSNGTPQPAPSPAMSPLCYSATVATTAQGWSDQCTFMHNAGRGNLGENLYATTDPPTKATPVEAVTAWAGEAQFYDYATNSCSAPANPGTCGHYTQVVWRDTMTVGCGITRCATNSPFPGFQGWTYVVCDYAPPGNVSVCDAQNHCVLESPY